MKPLFGGSKTDHRRATLLDETSNLNFFSVLNPSMVKRTILSYRRRKSMAIRKYGAGIFIFIILEYNTRG